MNLAEKKMRSPDAISAYLSDLLQIDPDEYLEPELASPNWRDVATHALLLEGDNMDVALPLDAFAGIELRQHVPELQVIPVDELADASPEFAVVSHRLVVKLRDSQLGISCRRAGRVIPLTEQCVFRHEIQDRPWLGGIVKQDWALVINAPALIQATAGIRAVTGTESASQYPDTNLAPDI